MLLPAAVVTGAFFFSEKFGEAAAANAVLQIAWFAVIAHIPAFKTGRMSYVDIAWPWGLTILGSLSFIYGKSNFFTTFNPWNRIDLVSLAYLFAGLRMGYGANMMLQKGFFNKEFPRYLFQKRRWAKRGITDENSWLYKIEMQKEIFVQCLCNTGILASPLLLQAFGYLESDTPLTFLEIFGWLMWVSSLAIEHIADIQKNKFALQCKRDGIKNAVCNVGLWKYSRHPNYFGEWMVWNSLCLTSIPSLIAMWKEPDELMLLKLLLTTSLILVSYGMYVCLVYYTGAIPAEYYSLQKRPMYADYQKSVNMFFPGPPKMHAL